MAGQAAVNYGYDNADRLLSITQGSSSVSIGYDNANRRSTLTLPNGIKLSYGYDNANELTGLTYTLGAGTVGTMTYGYDSDGRIINRGGTLDVTNLPAAVASASYDADGNLVSNGKNTYTWNTRNQLTGISGGTSASFLYDAMGRRESQTIGSTATNFLYDGLNLEQELNGTTPTVNYLTGANLDETLSRKDSKGTYSYLTDNLGSTLALTNSNSEISSQGSVSYQYDIARRRVRMTVAGAAGNFGAEGSGMRRCIGLKICLSIRECNPWPAPLKLSATKFTVWRTSYRRTPLGTM